MEPSVDLGMDLPALKRALEWELGGLDSRDLRAHAWYHGSIPRSRAEEIVLADGEFLVRDCTSQPAGNYVLTCRKSGLALHFVITKQVLQPDTVYERVQYHFEDDAYDTIKDLITSYVGSGRAITGLSGARISTPVNRMYPLSFYASKYPPSTTISLNSQQFRYPMQQLYRPSSPPLRLNSAEGRPRLPSKKQRSHSLTPAEVNRMATQQIQEKCNSADGVVTTRFNSLPRNACASTTRLSISASSVTLGRNAKLNRVGSDCYEDEHLLPEKPPPKPSRVPQLLREHQSPPAPDLQQSPSTQQSPPARDLQHSPTTRDHPQSLCDDTQLLRDPPRLLRDTQLQEHQCDHHPQPKKSNDDSQQTTNRTSIDNKVQYSPRDDLHNSQQSPKPQDIQQSPPAPDPLLSSPANDPHYQSPPARDHHYLQQSPPAAQAIDPPQQRLCTYHATSGGSDSGNGSGDSVVDHPMDPPPPLLLHHHRNPGGVVIKNPRYNNHHLLLTTSSATSLTSNLTSFDYDYDYAAAEQKLLLIEQPNLDDPLFTSFDLDNFQTILLPVNDNKPLDGQALKGIKLILRESGSRILANHLTRVDLDLVYDKERRPVLRPRRLGSDLELCTLPHGHQFRLDVIERTECLKLLVAITILTCSDETERAATLNKWIEVAIDTKTALGNLYGFCGIMLGLCLPQIQRLDSTWHTLRQKYTDSAFNFEAKLRPTLKNMNGCADPQAPNTTIPHLLPFVLLYERRLDDFYATSNELLVSCAGLGESSARDFGLGTLLAHLEAARKFLGASATFQRNADIVLGEARMEELTVDMFRTEFQLKFLWGSRGAYAQPLDRRAKFEQILDVMVEKYCNC